MTKDKGHRRVRFIGIVLSFLWRLQRSWGQERHAAIWLAEMNCVICRRPWELYELGENKNKKQMYSTSEIWKRKSWKHANTPCSWPKVEFQGRPITRRSRYCSQGSQPGPAAQSACCRQTLPPHAAKNATQYNAIGSLANPAFARLLFLRYEER